MSTYAPVKGGVTPEAPYGKARLAVGAAILAPLAVLAWWWVGERVFGFEILSNGRANVPGLAVVGVFLSLFAWACITRLFRDRSTRTGEIAWRVLRVGRTLCLWVGGGILLTSLGISILVSHFVHGNPMPPVWVALGGFFTLAGPVVVLGGLVPSYQILRYGREEIPVPAVRTRPRRVPSAWESGWRRALLSLAFWAVIAVVVIVIGQALLN